MTTRLLLNVYRQKYRGKNYSQSWNSNLCTSTHRSTHLRVETAVTEEDPDAFAFEGAATLEELRSQHRPLTLLLSGQFHDRQSLLQSDTQKKLTSLKSLDETRGV